MERRVTVIDLFCGIGGLTHGLIKAGLSVIAGVDSDVTCKYAYEKNNPGASFIHSDISKITGATLAKLYPAGTVRVLVGCAPCQPFSPHTQKNKDRSKDDKWSLLNHFNRIVTEIQPEIVSMENVPPIANTPVYKSFRDTLAALDYTIFEKNVNCSEYGVPQKRRRRVLLASKLGDIDLISGDNYHASVQTVRDTIAHLQPIEAGECSDTDPLHRSCKLSPLNKKRIRASEPGGTWMDWPLSLRSPCHIKPEGSTYTAVYSRMKWDAPGPTITTQYFNYGTGRFGHPEQDRALSLREGALLQTFPSDYDFINPETRPSIPRLGMHIGNAVPVELGYIIGKSIQVHIKEHCANGKQQSVFI